MEGTWAKCVQLDPHAIMHAATASLLSRVGVSLAAATTSPSAALELLGAVHPELFLIEPLLPESSEPDGIECIRRAVDADPELTVIALSGRDSPEWRQSVLDAGASALVSKSGPVALIEKRIADSLEEARCGAGPLVSSLTGRERQILTLVAEGRTNAAVGELLWLSRDTVKFHLANIYRKLGVSSRAEASRWARRHQLVQQSPEAETPEPLLPPSEWVASDPGRPDAGQRSRLAQ